ncbi:hypothetical protein OIU79_016765 [Salix purpurea]|uniref:Uncharacterized protein n=1 Tax=Salix purpurea TaxID=77065 RepID=A0A9Q0PFL1_SALPP|nr:hypothetical protein OIU79_016765 [Salix purpurea]
MAVERSSCLIVLLHMDVLMTIVINVLYYLIESNGVTQLPNNSVSLLLSARRIAELKEDECRVAVEDVMYMLEIRPSKDWELESIHSFEVLEMVREHVSTVIGLKANSSVADSWATTEVQKCRIGRVYAASILYGYFLKSASLRHHLDWCLALPHQDIHLGHRTTLQFPESQPSYGMKNLVFGHMSNKQSESQGTRLDRPKSELEKLKCYMMGFDSDTLHRCAKLKSEEAVNLIEKHSCALFGDEKTGVLENDEVILTSFSSLKRLVLEAVAFGCFLWDTEEYVNSWIWITLTAKSFSEMESVVGCQLVKHLMISTVRVLGCYSVLGEVKALLAVYVLRMGADYKTVHFLGHNCIIKPRFSINLLRYCLPSGVNYPRMQITEPSCPGRTATDCRCYQGLLRAGISASAALTGSALEGLVEKTRNSLHGVLENSLSQLAEDFGEMISAIMTALWNNYKDAVRYFTENA